MFTSLQYHIKSAMLNLYFNKMTTAFTGISYFIGLIMPLFVVLMIYHDEIQTKQSFMEQANQIVRVDTSLSMENAVQSIEQWKENETVEQVFYKTEHSGVISSEKTTRFGYYVYVDPYFHNNYKQFLQTGRWFNAMEKNECIISRDLSFKMFDAEAVSGEIYINGEVCTVVGTTKIFNNRVIKLHNSDQAWDGYTQFFVKLNHSDVMEQMIAEVKSTLAGATIQPLKSINDQYAKGQRINFGLLLLITLSVFIYAIITISNVIHFMLSDRMYRYGINLALGCKKSKLYMEYFLELLFVTSLSLIVALVTLLLAESSIEKYLAPIRIDGIVVVILFLCNMIVCLLLSFVYLRKILSPDIISLIRGKK